MSKIIIKRTSNNLISCYITDKNGKEYSIGFNNTIYSILRSIEDCESSPFFSGSCLFDTFHNHLFCDFDKNIRLIVHINGSFSIKYFYKLMWSKIYEMVFKSYKYYDSISLTFVPSNYIFEHHLSFYMINFLEKYFDIKIDGKIKEWIINYCNNILEVNDMDKKMFYTGIDYCKELKVMDKNVSDIKINVIKRDAHASDLKYLGICNPYNNLFTKITDYKIISRIKLTKDKKEDKCYMVAIWADKTITKVSLPVKSKEFDFESSNNINLLTLTLHKNPDLKDIWNDKNKTKFLFNSFLICFLKRTYPYIKINDLLECVNSESIFKIITTDKIFNLLSIITKMFSKNLYKQYYNIFFA